jgi:hypothetical protein
MTVRLLGPGCLPRATAPDDCSTRLPGAPSGRLTSVQRAHRCRVVRCADASHFLQESRARRRSRARWLLCEVNQSARRPLLSCTHKAANSRWVKYAIPRSRLPGFRDYSVFLIGLCEQLRQRDEVIAFRTGTRSNVGSEPLKHFQYPAPTSGEASKDCGSRQTLLSGFPKSAAIRSSPLFQPATPRVRHVLFGVMSPLVATKTGAPYCREMHATNERTLVAVLGADLCPRHAVSAVHVLEDVRRHESSGLPLRPAFPTAPLRTYATWHAHMTGRAPKATRTSFELARGTSSNSAASSSKPGSLTRPAMILPTISVRCSGWLRSSKATRANMPKRCVLRTGSRRSTRIRQYQGSRSLTCDVCV